MNLFSLGVEVEIPEWIGLILHSDDDLLKGAGHKYIRRVPTGNPKKPWKYFYKVSGGSGLGHHSEFLEGAAFKVAHNGKEGHFHILGVEGDRLRIKHDESGEESTLTKDALTALLHKEHTKAIGEHKERLKKELAAVSKHGSEKQKAKIQAEATKAGVGQKSSLETFYEEQQAKEQEATNRLKAATDGVNRHKVFKDLEQSVFLLKPALDRVYPKNERLRDFAAYIAKAATTKGFTTDQLRDGTKAYADGQSGIVILKDPDQAKMYRVYLPGKSSGEYGQIASVSSIGAAKDLVADLVKVADFRKDSMGTIGDDRLLAIANLVHPNLQGAAQTLGVFRHGGNVKAGLKTVLNEILTPFGLEV